MDPRLITILFLRALQQAGHQAVLASGDALWDRSDKTEGVVVLEGRIWSFHFETRPASVLEVDVSLVLSDVRGPGVLWQLEFPTDQSLPFWIGLGSPSEEIVRHALTELEDAACQHFSDPAFCRAVGGHPAGLPAGTPGTAGAHEVLVASSWTATDEGKITATAHESTHSTPAPVRSGPAPSDPNAIKPTIKVPVLMETAGTP